MINFELIKNLNLEEMSVVIGHLAYGQLQFCEDCEDFCDEQRTNYTQTDRCIECMIKSVKEWLKVDTHTSTTRRSNNNIWE